MMKSFIKIFSFIFLSIACFQADAQITVATNYEQPIFYVKDDALHTVVVPDHKPSDFFISPTWLQGEEGVSDSLLFFVTSDTIVGVYQRQGAKYAQMCADGYQVAKTELSCVTGVVYTIDVQPYRLLFVAFADGQNTLRIADYATNETVAIYCDACH